MISSLLLKCQGLPSVRRPVGKVNISLLFRPSVIRGPWLIQIATEFFKTSLELLFFTQLNSYPFGTDYQNEDVVIDKPEGSPGTMSGSHRRLSWVYVRETLV